MNNEKSVDALDRRVSWRDCHLVSDDDKFASNYGEHGGMRNVRFGKFRGA
jgi:hypothetical protein